MQGYIIDPAALENRFREVRLFLETQAHEVPRDLENLYRRNYGFPKHQPLPVCKAPESYGDMYDKEERKRLKRVGEKTKASDAENLVRRLGENMRDSGWKPISALGNVLVDSLIAYQDNRFVKEERISKIEFDRVYAPLIERRANDEVDQYEDWQEIQKQKTANARQSAYFKRFSNDLKVLTTLGARVVSDNSWEAREAFNDCYERSRFQFTELLAVRVEFPRNRHADGLVDQPGLEAVTLSESASELRAELDRQRNALLREKAKWLESKRPKEPEFADVEELVKSQKAKLYEAKLKQEFEPGKNKILMLSERKELHARLQWSFNPAEKNRIQRELAFDDYKIEKIRESARAKTEELFASGEKWIREEHARQIKLVNDWDLQPSVIAKGLNEISDARGKLANLEQCATVMKEHSIEIYVNRVPKLNHSAVERINAFDRLVTPSLRRQITDELSITLADQPKPDSTYKRARAA